MMSVDRFDDQCPGCRPCLVDVTSGEVLSENSPPMRAVLTMWAKTTRSEREAFHRVACLNSRAAVDVLIVEMLGAQMAAAIKTVQ
jgi:hypothetical protein